MDFYNSGLYGSYGAQSGYGYQNGYAQNYGNYYSQPQYGQQFNSGQQYLPAQQYGGYEPQYVASEAQFTEQPSTVKYRSPSISNLASEDCRISPSRTKNEVIREPSPAPIIRRDVQRAPTPEPDVIERLIYRREPQQIIERVIEQPKKPPPRVVTKVINEPRGQPIVRTRCVLVDPRTRANVQNEVQQSSSFIGLPNSRINNYNEQTQYINQPVQLPTANIGLRPSTSNTTILQ
jgi:hypothetical protein